MSAEADAVASMLQLATNQDQVPPVSQGPTAANIHDDDVEIDNPSDSSLSELEDRAGSEAEVDDGEDDDLSDIEVEEEEGNDGEDESDGGDRHEEEDPANDDGVEEDGGEDTEAETERLHDSPEKLRNARNVHHRAEDQLQLPDDNVDQTSEISALSESETGGMSHMDSPVSSPRKRKREELESEDEREDEVDMSLHGVSRKLAKHVGADEEEADEIDGEGDQRDGKEGEEDGSDDERASSKGPTPDREASPKPARKGEGEHSGPEDVDADAEVDGEVKSEEDPGKKESALSSLRIMEKDFARLRDEMFADKMQQLNNELEVLQHNPMDHLGYSAGVEAVDRRRDEQVRQARTGLDYKIRSLQNKSVAERAMAHSQYMQDVRQIRDDALQEAGEEWYRIQKARRQGDGDDEFEKRYHFVPDRSIQFSRQVAYNQEVSIISGIQKHVGFPAAPSVDGLPEAQREGDLKVLGISTRQKNPIAAPLSAFQPRHSQPAVDEHFYKANPWADPQNALAAHAQLQPQAHQYATPAIARQAPQGSASTIAVSSVEQTPMSNQAQQVAPRYAVQLEASNETPSRIPVTSHAQNGVHHSPQSSPLKAPLPSIPVQAGSG